MITDDDIEKGLTVGDKISIAKTRHGMSHTKVHNAWTAMLGRCLNPNNSRWGAYGGRGISVCNRWKTFENFYLDMGDPPSPRHQIDRINNDGNYEPGNCRWATVKMNCNNHRRNVVIEYQGQRKTLTQWAEFLGIKVGTLWQRLRNGWTYERALSKHDYRRIY